MGRSFGGVSLSTQKTFAILLKVFKFAKSNDPFRRCWKMLYSMYLYQK